MRISSAAFLQVAVSEFTSRDKKKSSTSKFAKPTLSIRQFKSLFGLSPIECKQLWLWLERSLDVHDIVELPFHRPEHLLYVLNYLKTYRMFDDMAATTGRDEKTLCKWCWIVIEFLADQEWVSIKWLEVHTAKTNSITHNILHSMQIKWEDQLIDDNGSICKTTTDGTDYKIQEPSPFDEKWYSEKFNGPAVRYLITMCIQTGCLVHVDGPYPAGAWPDLHIAQNKLCHLLCESQYEDELACGDGGFQDGREFFATPPGHNNEIERMRTVARARHEMINRHFKQWSILHDVYCGKLNRHGTIFHAVANITQLVLQMQELTFGVDYYDRED